MNSQTAQSKRSAAYRRSLEAQGQQQMQIWVRRELREQLDELVRAGGFKNRSEAVTAAVHQFLEAQRM